MDHQESVQIGQTVEEVHRGFRHHPHAFVAVVRDGIYAGLVSRGHLGYLLGTRYGFALHSGHLIQDHLLPHCLSADPSMPLLELLERALSRTGETFYQDVPMVGQDGRFLGIIPVPALVRAQSALFAEQNRLAESVRHRMALSDKTALFESLAGGIAHELNNTLTPVLGYAELLGMRLEAAADQGALLSYCRMITKSAQESVRIIRQLLQLSRPATMELRKVDLGAILTEAVSIMRFRLRSSEAEMALEIPESGVRILADAVQIKQVVINLLINAIDAMEHTTRKELKVRVAVQDAMAELRVEDTGHGIPAEKLNRIFDPFYTTKSAERGTGLGLSVCLGIVGQHRGEISVSSVPGEGTVFRVLLPLALAGEPEVEAPKAFALDLAPDSAAGLLDTPPRLDVLVIDDEAQVTSLVHELLRSRLGWRVEEVHDGREAIQRLESARFDLVITDLRMPGLDGFALLGWIRDFRPALLSRVLVITGDSGSQAQDRELRDLGVPALRKPFSSEDLVTHCRELVNPPA